MTNFQNKSIFLTGGTGSIGRALLSYLLEKDEVKKVTIFSRDEMKQWEMEEEFHSSKLNFVLGDVRDFERVSEVMEGHELVIHLAALKQVPKGETNPSEFIKTNVLGTQNLIKAAKLHNPECLLFLSTDKAVNPTSNYGSSKLTGEKLILKVSEQGGTNYIILRLGNVMNTRGTVVPRFLNQKNSGRLSVTNPESTRFHLTIESAVTDIIYAVHMGKGGEVIIPRLNAFSMANLARAVCPECEVEVVGLRKGEKKHEVLLAENEIPATVENKDYYIVLPDFKETLKYEFAAHYKAKPVSADLIYASDIVNQLPVDDLSRFINELGSTKKPKLYS